MPPLISSSILDEIEYRLLIVGSPGVGKSALTMQIVQNQFVGDYDPTIEDTYQKQHYIDDELCLLRITDTAPDGEYSAMNDRWKRSTQGFMIVYSVASRLSFEAINTFKEEVLRMRDADQVPIVLVGNKTDMEEERAVSTAEGKHFADLFDCPFFETSAKSRINVEEAFCGLIREVKKFQKNSTKTIQPKHKRLKKKICSLM